MSAPAPVTTGGGAHSARGRVHTPAHLGGAVAVFVSSFVVLAVLALGRWNTGLVTNYDLGIFSQSAASYADGQWPHSAIRQLDLMGDHFSPILALNGVAWSIWPDPRMLLLVQSGLIALAAAMIFLAARQVVAARWAAVGTAAFVLSRGVASAAMFDFHEIAYAAPLVALLCVGLIRRRFVTVVLASVLLLLVKEDLGLTVIGAGLAWFVLSSASWRGRDWRRALLLVLLGVAGVVLATVVISMVNPTGGSTYLSYFGIGDATPTGPQGGLFDRRRLVPLGLYTLSTLIIGWRSPLTWVALPTLAWRTASSSVNYWSSGYHYDLVPTVIAAFAAIHAVTLIDTRRLWVRLGAWGCGIACVVLGLQHDASRLPEGLRLGETQQVQATRTLAGTIPEGSRVMAQNDLGAYVPDGRTVLHLASERDESARYVLFDLTPAWDYVYPQCARRSLLERAERETEWQVRRTGDVVLIDFGHEQRLPAAACR